MTEYYCKFDDDGYYACHSCEIAWYRQEDLSSHLQNDCPYRFVCRNQPVTTAAVSSYDFQCTTCHESFRNFDAKEHHRKTFHPAVKDHACPFCNRRHPSPSAVMAHLESGGCRFGANKQLVDDYIFRSTTSGASSGGILVTRNQAQLEPCVVYRATELSMNSRGYYECYFCHGMEFVSLAGLNQHLESPKHSKRSPALYSCPACGMYTQTLSGLIQHAEMGNCGIRQNVSINNALDSITQGIRQISF